MVALPCKEDTLPKDVGEEGMLPLPSPVQMPETPEHDGSEGQAVMATLQERASNLPETPNLPAGTAWAEMVSDGEPTSCASTKNRRARKKKSCVQQQAMQAQIRVATPRYPQHGNAEV